MQPLEHLLYQAPVLDDREREVIAAVASINQNVGVHVITPPRWQGKTARGVLTPPPAGGGAPLAEAGFRRAMSYVLARARETPLDYNAELLRALHFMLSEHDPAAAPGCWRVRGGGVLDYKHHVVYRAPDAGQIAGLIALLLDSLNHDSGLPIVRAAMVHLNLVRIHPFRDGNGRLARSLDALIMARAGYRAPALLNVEEYAGWFRAEYEAALATAGETWTPLTSTRKWLRFNLTMRYRLSLTLLREFRRFVSLSGEIAGSVASRAPAEPSAAFSPLAISPSIPPLGASQLIDRTARINGGFAIIDPPAAHAAAFACPADHALLRPALIEAGAAAPDPFS